MMDYLGFLEREKMGQIQLMVETTNKILVEQFKDNPLYKMIIKSIPELLVSAYVLLVFFTSLSHQEGIKELVSFLQQIGFKSLADGLNGVAQYIDGYRGIGLFVVIIFVFAASLNSYILWYKYEIRRVEDCHYIKAPGSAYFMVLAIGAWWDYFKWVSIPLGVLLPCVFVLFVSVVINIKWVGSELISLKKFKKDWEDVEGGESSFRVFCWGKFISPIVISIIALPVVLGYVLVGLFQYPKKDGVVFRSDGGLTQEEQKKRMDRREAIIKDFKESVAYNKKHQEIMSFVDGHSGRGYKILPIIPEDTAVSVYTRIRKVAKGNPAVLVFADDERILDVQVVNIPIEPKSQGDF
ncbi:hypothetical protein [Rothia mucilaginosa]